MWNLHWTMHYAFAASCRASFFSLLVLLSLLQLPKFPSQLLCNWRSGGFCAAKHENTFSAKRINCTEPFLNPGPLYISCKSLNSNVRQLFYSALYCGGNMSVVNGLERQFRISLSRNSKHYQVLFSPTSTYPWLKLSPPSSKLSPPTSTLSSTFSFPHHLPAQCDGLPRWGDEK